jgi:hypothetical protein
VSVAKLLADGIVDLRQLSRHVAAPVEIENKN